MSLSKSAAGIGLAAALTVPLGGNALFTRAGSAVAPPAAAATTVVAPPLDEHAPVKFGDRVLHVASEFRGTPYRLGGTTPHGFDCSGFTRFVYRKFHKRLPRTAEEQFEHAQRVTDPQIGDLIFYHAGRNGHVYHVGIYAGPGRVWHAPHPGDRVREGKIYSSHWTAGRY